MNENFVTPRDSASDGSGVAGGAMARTRYAGGCCAPTESAVAKIRNESVRNRPRL